MNTQTSDPAQSSSTTATTTTGTTTQSPNIVTGTQSTGTLSGTTTTQNTLTSTQADTQVTTIVQQLDAQGPAVVERITTQFADVACTPENARLLVDALHGGTAVTLTADGKTATFTPTTRLGYGETYIALALAAEALRAAGVTGCATPEQWRAVLLGGPLAAAGTTSTTTSRSATASSSSRFPGILALRSQGQGWGQIAQTTNVQLGQVVGSAQSSFNLNTSGDSTLSPTGRTSTDFNQFGATTGATDSDKPGKGDEMGKRKGHEKGKAKGHENRDNRDDDRSRDNEGKAQPNR